MTVSTNTRPGTLIVSLDFELMWGVRESQTVKSYGDAILGGREAIPKILRRFSQAGIRATWATVGLLFARNKDEMLDHAPSLRPTYTNTQLSPYHAIEHEIGRDETSDPLHYGYSLVERIRETEGQEIGTHTYSHYYCLEEGQTLAQFEADLKSACSIAGTCGVTLTSMVFPRNQSAPDYVAACSRQGIRNWRGNPGGIYAARRRRSDTSWVRAMRLADSVLPVTGDLSFEHPAAEDGTVNIRASRFLRPYSRTVPQVSHLQIHRVISEMGHAARTGQCYHLWWHPHNFGRSTDMNLAALDQIIRTFRELADTHGMVSQSMKDLGDAVHSGKQ